MSGRTIGLAIAGLGTVGTGLIKILQTHGDLIGRRGGANLKIVAVSSRDQSKDRGVDLSGIAWETDPQALASRDDVDIVVELIGGSDGPAKDLVQAALAAGKHVVTANKALIAIHGPALASQAEAQGVALNFEAAVAGGIPIVKAMREGLSANAVSRVYGILNGTCNYILTEMEQTGRGFADVLADAQALGYAEADPSFDVGGIDAAHKLAILASLGFGQQVDFDSVDIEGIEQITAMDIGLAGELGYRIKLLGMAERVEGGIIQRVGPYLVPLHTPIAEVGDVFNAVSVDADFVDTTFYVGRGAGEGPTASAVMADIVDIARGTILPVFGQPEATLAASTAMPPEAHVGAFYVQLVLRDEPGGIAAATRCFADHGISIASMVQHGRGDGPDMGVPVVFITHDTSLSDLKASLDGIAQMTHSLSKPRMIPIASFDG